MKIFIHSCHAALEYDHARLFSALGHQVVGTFDVGSIQRPKLPGITDRNVPGESLSLTAAPFSRSTFLDADCIVLHQTGDFDQRAALYADTGLPVISVAFGQGCMRQFQRVAAEVVTRPNVFIAAYSKTDYHRYLDLIPGAPRSRVRMIRFCSDQPQKWNGSIPACMVACNSLADRMEACSGHVIEGLRRRNVPLLLIGRDTERMGGLGELAFADVQMFYRAARCYLSLGTAPAPYTMTLMEAMTTGMPVAAWNNRHGIRDEGFSGLYIADTVDTLADRLLAWTADIALAYQAAEECRRTALAEFNPATISGQWQSLFTAAAEVRS